ncbi:MAG: DUF1659 domain-containing protein [Ectobacillus sp.]
MAIQAAVTDMSLRLVLNAGKDENGKTMLKNKVYKFVKVDAAPEQIHEAATALASLQTYTLEAINMMSTTDVINA